MQLNNFDTRLINVGREKGKKKPTTNHENMYKYYIMMDTCFANWYVVRLPIGYQAFSNGMKKYLLSKLTCRWPNFPRRAPWMCPPHPAAVESAAPPPFSSTLLPCARPVWRVPLPPVVGSLPPAASQALPPAVIHTQPVA